MNEEVPSRGLSVSLFISFGSIMVLIKIRVCHCFIKSLIHSKYLLSSPEKCLRLQSYPEHNFTPRLTFIDKLSRPVGYAGRARFAYGYCVIFFRRARAIAAAPAIIRSIATAQATTVRTSLLPVCGRLISSPSASVPVPVSGSMVYVVAL